MGKEPGTREDEKNNFSSWGKGFGKRCMSNLRTMGLSILAMRQRTHGARSLE